jgi:hypothetical protein
MSAFNGLTYMMRPFRSVASKYESAGKNAASVLPEAVAAAMIVLIFPFRIIGIARSWASLREPHFSAQM